MKPTSAMLVLVLSAACAPLEFYPHADGGFTLRKVSDLCAAGVPSAITNDLRAQAKMICAGRRESYREVEVTEEIGIPVFRCASAELAFRCVPSPAN